MQGDLNVDLLMLPVLHAIKRHVKDGTAVTEIYNRAYEAVMEVQDALNVADADEFADVKSELDRKDALKGGEE